MHLSRGLSPHEVNVCQIVDEKDRFCVFFPFLGHKPNTESQGRYSHCQSFVDRGVCACVCVCMCVCVCVCGNLFDVLRWSLLTKSLKGSSVSSSAICGGKEKYWGRMLQKQ